MGKPESDGPADEPQSTGVDYLQVVSKSTTKPEAPQSPFEQFSYQTTHKATNDGMSSDTDLSPEYLMDAWEKLGTEGQQFWEAQYGRQMLRYQQALELWEQEHPQPRVTYNLEQGLKLDHKVSHVDRSFVLGAFDHFIERCCCALLGLTPEEKVSQVGDADHQDISPISDEERPANIIFRAKLYQLRDGLYTPDGRQKLEAACLKTYEHHAQMQFANRSADENTGNAIFEVTTFLRAPSLPRRRGWNRIIDPSSSESDVYYPGPPRSIRPARYNPDKPLAVGAEAGMILTINSEVILEAIHSVAPGYPDLAFDGDSLIVAEPFCVLLQFRKEMLEYRDSLERSESVSKSRQDKQPVERIQGPMADGRSSMSKPSTELSSSQRAHHITEIYNFLDQRYSAAIAAEQQRWRQTEPVCTFEWAWLLFTPSTLVYERTTDSDQLPRAFLVESFSLRGLFNHDRHSKKPIVKPSRLDARQKLKLRHRLRKITILLTYLRHDGRKWISGKRKVDILPFNGERLITNLPVYPVGYLNDPQGDIRARLIQRGRRYHMMASRGIFEYHGQTLSGTRRWLNSRIVVDSETYYYDSSLAAKRRHNRERRGARFTTTSRHRVRRLSENSSDDDKASDFDDIPPTPRPRYRPARTDSDSDSGSDASLDWDIKVANILGRKDEANFVKNTPLRKQPLTQLLRNPEPGNAKISDDIYLMCDREVNAYVLEERDWVRLDVDKITDCSFQETMIDDLQVSDETKRLIQALSQSYATRGSHHHDHDSEAARAEPSSSSTWSSEFVPNKGRGQVLLLHGKPGVGKTTAAECVAELTKRPLISITCGDLGTSSWEVERRLRRWLRLGALWKGLLLFDEADIFLESRRQSDIERNSLVSVFLRALEYYQGLIFLTTNRVGTFDEAVISRVNVVLHFPDLTNDDRARIWDTSFRKLGNERPDVKVDFSIYDYAYRDETIRNLKWNGREIRNAFNTMIALAEWDAKDKGKYTKDGKIELRREHLQQVARLSNNFKEYLQSLRGFGEADHAKYQGLRDDLFPKQS